MKPAQQARSRAKVDAILAAARARLQATPEEPLTTSALAADAGIAVATLYRYFDHVDDVLDVLVHEHAEASAVALEAALAATPTSVIDVYRAVLDAHLALYDARPELTRTWASAQLAARQAAIEAASDRRLAHRVADHLVAAGLVPDDATPRVQAVAHWNAVGSLLGAVLAAPSAARPALEADLRRALDALATGLAGGGPTEQTGCGAKDEGPVS